MCTKEFKSTTGEGYVRKYSQIYLGPRVQKQVLSLFIWYSTASWKTYSQCSHVTNSRSAESQRVVYSRPPTLRNNKNAMAGWLGWLSVGLPILRSWVQIPLQSKFSDFDFFGLRLLATARRNTHL